MQPSKPAADDTIEMGQIDASNTIDNDDSIIKESDEYDSNED